MKEIRQRDFNDCGVTCIEYIMNYYGGHVPIEKLREDTFTTTKGTTAYHIVETLKKYGFDSYGEKIEIKDLQNLTLPVIIHLTLNNGLLHFAVLCKVGKKEVTLMDPSYGKKKMKFSALEGMFDGVVLHAIPKSSIPNIPRDKSVILKLFHLLVEEKKLVLPILIFSVLLSFLSIVINMYFKVSLETVTSKEDALWQIIFLFVVLYFFKMIFQYGKNYFKFYLDKNIETKFTFSFFRHLFSLPLEKFETYHEGELLTRIRESREIKELFETTCITFFLEFILSFFSLICLFLMNSQLTFILVIGMGVYFILCLITSKSFYHLILKNMEIEERWNERLIETIQNYPSMKHLNQVTEYLDLLEESFCSSLKDKLHIEKVAFFYHFIKENFLELLFFFLTSYGIYLILKGHLTVIHFMTFQNLYFYFINPMKELVDILPKYYYLKGIFQKISEMMSLKEEKHNEYIEPLPYYSLEIKNVSYSYNQIEKIFENVSFEVKEKEHIFLDGKSGSGKSTICKILRQELENYEGTILFSKRNILDYPVEQIRKTILYLSQNEHIVCGTIKDNILYGKKETERFYEVLDICELESIVSKKPLRYDTYISEDYLSGGEKQRILLARTLYCEGNIYIFDEALSEVEDILEKKIIKNIRKFLKDKSIIYISHRKNHKEFERGIIL